MGKLTWQTAGLTDQGCVRSDNQDNFFISDDGKLLVVADGMGGAEGGAIASRLTIETFERLWCPSVASMDAEQLQEWLEKAIVEANGKVCQAAMEHPTAKNMGTTVVAAVQSDNDELHLAHVGDSRAYVIRGGTARQLTNDHSVVYEMFLRGQITSEQCQTSPWRHLITRCIGHEREVQGDFQTFPLESGDVLLLASDGLSCVVEEPLISQLVSESGDAEGLCRRLIEVTLAKGAPDNVTVAVSAIATACVDGVGSRTAVNVSSAQ